MSQPADNSSAQRSPSPDGDTGDHSPSTDPTRVVPPRSRTGDLNDTIVLEQLHLDPANRAGSLGRIGTYEVLDIIGRGGMGIVLRAFDETLHRNVAIKVISPTILSTGNTRDRFLREARAAGGINHSNVVTIYGVGEHAGFPYLVMEFVDGQSLQQHIKAGVPLSELEVVKISLQIACGLEAAHRHLIIHRDIKPGNIMLQEDTDRVKITDFGLARATFETSDLTTDGGIVGTPSFMSPEQVLGQPLDHRSDLFSLGCVIYAMFVGHSPFRSESPIASAGKVHGESHSSLRKACPEAPDYLVDIVDKLLEKKPQDRYDSAKTVVDILSLRLAKLSEEDFDETQAWMQQQRTASGSQHTRRGSLWILLLVASVIAASTLAIAFWPGNESLPIVPIDPAPVIVPGKLTVAVTGPAQFRTLQDALNQATPGCTIEVLDNGTYTGPFKIDDPKKFKGVRLIAAHRPLINVRRHATCLMISDIENFRLEGFRFETVAVQHGLEIKGHCPGTTIANCEFLALEPRGDVRAPVHFRGGTSGTDKAPITIQRCRIQGGGVGIVLGANNEVEPVEFALIEECFIQGDGRDYGVAMVLQTAIRQTVIRRNILRSGDCAFSFLFNQPETAVDLTIRDNTLDGFESAFRMNGSVPQQSVKIQSNLIINSRTVWAAPGALPDYVGWFSGNWWEISPGYDESNVKAIAELQSGVALQSRDPSHTDYLKPAPNAPGSMPGRFGSKAGNESTVP